MDVNTFASGQAAGQEFDIDALLVQLEAERSPDDNRSPPKNIDDGILQSLTPREHDVLKLIADGLSDKEIALALGIAPGTVKWFGAQIRSKLAVNRRTHAVARARELGILD